MNIEIKKENITRMGKEDIITYTIIPFDEEIIVSLDEMKELRDFLNEYIDKEEKSTH